MILARLIVLCLLALAASASPAGAHWDSSGTGAGTGAAATMPTAAQPSASVAGASVTVAWTQNTFLASPLGSFAGGGDTIKRYVNGGSTATTPNASCSTTISGGGATLRCVDAPVPDGSWQYTVTSVSTPHRRRERQEHRRSSSRLPRRPRRR